MAIYLHCYYSHEVREGKETDLMSYTKSGKRDVSSNYLMFPLSLPALAMLAIRHASRHVRKLLEYPVELV